MFNNLSFIENRAIYEIQCKTFAESVRTQMTKWSNLITCWIPAAKNTHSEYVIVFASLQQRLH
jgi:hypothetical protein